MSAIVCDPESKCVGLDVRTFRLLRQLSYARAHDVACVRAHDRLCFMVQRFLRLVVCPAPPSLLHRQDLDGQADDLAPFPIEDVFVGTEERGRLDVVY